MRGDYVIRPWYKRGDVGWVIVADFDSDAALQTGREAEPNTRRNHAPEDSLFLGGVCPRRQGTPGAAGDALVLAAGSVYLAVSKTGIAIHGDVDIRGELTTHKRTDSPDGDDGLSG